MPERATFIAQAEDNGSHYNGLSLILQPFDRTIEDSDAAEKLLQKPRMLV